MKKEKVNILVKGGLLNTLKSIFKRKEKLSVGLDLDGTITEHIPFFRKFTQTNAFDIYIITARGEVSRDFTAAWLKKNKIKYKELIMERNKAVACLERNIVLMFENDIEELSLLHEAGVKVACLPDGTWRPGEIQPAPLNIPEWWQQVFRVSKFFLDKKNPLKKH